MSLASETDAAREYARNVGYDNSEAAWILSPYDAWYPNPFYCGPKVPHPETDPVEVDYVSVDWPEPNSYDDYE